MKTWDHMRVYRCKCGFETVEEELFTQHIRKPGHEDADAVKKEVPFFRPYRAGSNGK